MLKTAETKYPILDLIAQRWSPLAFANREVENEKLLSIFEAGRWAPSSYNEQPWFFIVAKSVDSQQHAQILNCLEESNKEWAKNAPVLIISVAKQAFSKNGKANRHAFHDVGLAAENMVIQATALGLLVHQMAGIKPQKIKEVFEIPEGFEAVTAIAIGYEGDASFLTPELRNRQLAERSRRPLEEFIFSERWGNRSKILDR